MIEMLAAPPLASMIALDDYVVYRMGGLGYIKASGR